MLSLISPVPTPWHRLPAGAKLAGLCLFSLALFWTKNPAILGAALVAVALAYAVGGAVFSRHGMRMLRPLWPFVAVLVVWHLWTGELQEGLAILLRLIAAVAAANLVTMTTRLTDIVAVIERLCAPLARFGVSPRLPGLAVGLVIRFIPVMGERVARLTEAWRARSPRPAGWRIALPATLGALDDAEQVAEALRARGGAG
ncbi:MAG: ABC transporter permease [Cereibacter sphaeroides]|uniref:ABC transporter permease n=1 Tax=Cereibacter sphaeroides TaxID=1063 RepID=A0A2W5SLN5_CERSP|nr:MAG: ABC transporter permease [Cereibacter sphaeroides]